MGLPLSVMKFWLTSFAAFGISRERKAGAGAMKKRRLEMVVFFVDSITECSLQAAERSSR